MPFLPHLYQRAATATDSRILDSRQWGEMARRAAESLPGNGLAQLKRTPTRVGRTTTLVRRDQSDPRCAHGLISACYTGLDSGPSPGVVVGIVLGSIAGFLLLIWVLWVLSSGGNFIRTTALEVEDVSVTRRRSRSPRSRRSHRSSYNAEMRRTSPRRDRVIRQERIVRDVPSSRRERDRHSSRVHESVIIEESSRPDRRVDGDDVVEVIEEHSSEEDEVPPPRRKSRRGSNYNR